MSMRCRQHLLEGLCVADALPVFRRPCKLDGADAHPGGVTCRHRAAAGARWRKQEGPRWGNLPPTGFATSAHRPVVTATGHAVTVYLSPPHSWCMPRRRTKVSHPRFVAGSAAAAARIPDNGRAEISIA